MKFVGIPLFALRFSNWIHFKNAEEYIFNRHPMDFDWHERQMVILFLSEENRVEMKQVFDTLGWKSEIYDWQKFLDKQ